MISFFGEDVLIPDIDVESVKSCIINAVEGKNKKVADINFVFCSDTYLLSMNKNYLNHDYYTDILTFNYNEDDYISGDLFISIDRVKENADIFNVLYTEELLRVCIHGILHLLGYDDNTVENREKMRIEEDKHLKLFFDVKKI